MAEMKDAHIVEIPVDEEHQQKLICSMNSITAIQNHPLAEISNSPGHLLLLKLWQREEDLFGRRIALKESRMDSIKREIFQLCCFFLVFHGLFLTILFTSSVESEEHSCKKWWIPSLVSVFTSLVFVFLVQVKVCRYWKVWRQLQREKNDNRALTRCIQELRMKGASFDLSKEPLSGKRMKSSSVWCFLLPNSCFADSDQGRLLACGFLPTEGCDDLNSKVFSAPFLQEFLMLDFGRFDDVIASLISSRG
ncbi:hypothetical protein OIU77_015670 [Salix suchowensis]|uniref:Uncharacterized protein n=1 Tax=Salix suchowensis TaxID=1278906 RepID=A0ABQ8ZHR3_9ROSI|nr:hypothetical protein OIU77_015670 [Salix suchowensis]